MLSTAIAVPLPILTDIQRLVAAAPGDVPAG